MEADGGFIMCEVGEQQAVRVEAQPQKRRAVIRVASEESQDYAMKRRWCGLSKPGDRLCAKCGKRAFVGLAPVRQ